MTLFDEHRSQYGERGTCVDPDLLGQEFRDRMWRGPAMTPEQKIARFGEAA